jgi:hypothetical protein
MGVEASMAGSTHSLGGVCDPGMVGFMTGFSIYSSIIYLLLPLHVHNVPSSIYLYQYYTYSPSILTYPSSTFFCQGESLDLSRISNSQDQLSNKWIQLVGCFVMSFKVIRDFLTNLGFVVMEASGF